MKTSVTERFFSNVSKTDFCWVWTGRLNATGYGVFSGVPKAQSAHRASYALFKGELILGLVICHTCDVRNCVNPDHLYQGTQADNVRDAIERKRLVWSNQTHCKHGHPLSGDNLRTKNIKKGRSRLCIICISLRSAKYRLKRRGGKDPRPHWIRPGDVIKGVKLTPATAIEIKIALREGERVNALARKYGVSHQTISRINQGETWKHANPEPKVTHDK